MALLEVEYGFVDVEFDFSGCREKFVVTLDFCKLEIEACWIFEEAEFCHFPVFITVDDWGRDYLALYSGRGRVSFNYVADIVS